MIYYIFHRIQCHIYWTKGKFSSHCWCGYRLQTLHKRCANGKYYSSIGRSSSRTIKARWRNICPFFILYVTDFTFKNFLCNFVFARMNCCVHRRVPWANEWARFDAFTKQQPNGFVEKFTAFCGSTFALANKENWKQLDQSVSVEIFYDVEHWIRRIFSLLSLTVISLRPLTEEYVMEIDICPKESQISRYTSLSLCKAF